MIMRQLLELLFTLSTYDHVRSSGMTFCLCEQWTLNISTAAKRHGVHRWLKCCFTLRNVALLCLMSSDVSWHIREKLWPMPKHGSTVGLLRSGAQDVHLDFHTAPELCVSTANLTHLSLLPFTCKCVVWVFSTCTLACCTLSTHKGVDYFSKYVTQTRQHRHESPTRTLPLLLHTEGPRSNC